MAKTYRQIFGNYSTLNILFVSQPAVIALVASGILPRTVVPFWTIALAVYVLMASLENSTVFFVRSIPFFVAIPITAGFDSLNMWRIFSGLIFLKWFWVLKPKIMPRFSRSSFILLALLLLMILSISQAQSHVLAVKRIIYFVNLSMIGIVIYDLIRKNQDFCQRIIKNVAIPTIFVALVGMVQLVSTYFMDIFQFVDFWGGVVERNMYGNVWAETAIKANTWFAYFGNQLSLRMFSIFPDSHSFPIFMLLGLPAVMTIALKRVTEKSGNFKTMLQSRASVIIIFIPVIFLALILTGTRGIWAAGAASSVWAIFLIARHRMSCTPNITCRAVFAYISSFLVIFFLLFGVAYYIIASNQFMAEKDSTGLLAKRARSVLDISETSNARRIEIWKDSIRSIIKHPLLGVGIGNFPAVVGEDLARAKAGSSAHNLYLHIAAETGLPALILALWFLWLLLKKSHRNFLTSVTSYQLPIIIYFASLLIFLPWVLIYSLTDVAMFDERAFLLFAVTAAIISGTGKILPDNTLSNQ
ncbi:MAG: O-antigen ligase family protein [Candidatus Yanofskybacteria bacterium]|nr:O-antigen ligase family protein [Candidatus Yanofskybacteria bacterium]